MQTIRTVKLELKADEVKVYLRDVRRIEKDYGLGETFSYDEAYIDFENLIAIKEETPLAMTLAFISIFVVVLLITFDLRSTLLVVFTVLLVNMLMIGSVYFLDLYMNHFVVLSVTFALGIAIDYSAHIAHAFNSAEPY